MTIDAVLRGFPVAQAAIRFGEALVVAIVKWKSCRTALPLPAPPPPSPTFDGLRTPQLNDATSISPGWALSVLSPSIPSIFRNASNCAMASLHSRECQMELRSPVPAQLPRQLAGEIAPGGAGVPACAAEDHEVAAVRTPGRRAETVQLPAGQVEGVDLQARRRRERRVERQVRSREAPDRCAIGPVQQLRVCRVSVSLARHLPRTPRGRVQVQMPAVQRQLGA